MEKSKKFTRSKDCNLKILIGDNEFKHIKEFYVEEERIFFAGFYSFEEFKKIYSSSKTLKVFENDNCIINTKNYMLSSINVNYYAPNELD